MKAKWLLDYNMIKDSYHKPMDEVCNELGIPYQVIKYVPMASAYGQPPLEKEPVFNQNDCVVGYGCIEFLNAIQYYKKNYIPSSYMENDSLSCKHYIPKLPINTYLNEDYIMIPYLEFKNNPERLYNIFNTKNLFIRPDSGLKTFAGTTIDLSDFDYEIRTLDCLTSAVDSTLILLSSIKNIKEEYRIVIGNKKIIASSRYKLNNTLSLKEGAPKEVLDVAEKMANNKWQPDLVYTCDIAVLDNGLVKIIELNSFSAAGLYACNLKDVVLGVSKIAELEHAGDLYIED